MSQEPEDGVEATEQQLHSRAKCNNGSDHHHNKLKDPDTFRGMDRQTDEDRLALCFPEFASERAMSPNTGTTAVRLGKPKRCRLAT